MKEKKFQLRMPMALLEPLQKSATKNMRSLNSEVVVLVRDNFYCYKCDLGTKLERWTTTLRMPEELHTELTLAARHAEHSINVEILSRLAAGLGVTRLGENKDTRDEQ